MGTFQQFHRTKERLAGRPHMEDFTPEEELVGRSSRNRALYPAAVVSHNVKQRARNVEAARLARRLRVAANAKARLRVPG